MCEHVPLIKLKNLLLLNLDLRPWNWVLGLHFVHMIVSIEIRHIPGGPLKCGERVGGHYRRLRLRDVHLPTDGNSRFRH